MYFRGGMSSLSHIFHHSRLTIADSVAVGCCCHCADHFWTGRSALIESSEALSQNSGQSGSPLGMMAGNSTTSHWSDIESLVCCANRRPVKSFLPQRVLWLTIPLAIKFSVLSTSTSKTSSWPSGVTLTISSVVKLEVVSRGPKSLWRLSVPDCEVAVVAQKASNSACVVAVVDAQLSDPVSASVGL
jgi:hypothetical protein